MLVGTKDDLRQTDDARYTSKVIPIERGTSSYNFFLFRNHLLKHLTFHCCAGEQVAKTIGAIAHFVCSAKEGYGLKEIMYKIAPYAEEYSKNGKSGILYKKERRCIIL